MLNATQQLTLDEVKLNFQRWRAHRKRGARIPNELWEQIRQLSQQNYKPSRIYNTLGISGSQYKKNVSQQELHSTFVEVSTHMQSDQSPCTAFKSISERETAIEIHRHDGALLSITYPSPDLVSHVIQNFLR